MNKMILSNNFNVTNEQGKSVGQQKSNTISVSTSSSNTEATTVGASVSAKISLFPNLSVSANISHEWSSMVSSEHSSSNTSSQEQGQTWTHSLGINTSEVAFLNGNVKYLNVGTAPIYEVRPTLNFVLGIGELSNTIATIIAKSNTTANVILPGAIFPDKVQNSIVWNTIDDFNSQPIKLNYEQVEPLQTGVPLQIQTIQTSGLYKTYTADMLPMVNEYQKWDHIMVDIYNRTACLTLIFENGDIQERRVSARKEDNYDDQSQPELTLGEAFEIAFNNAKVNNDVLVYNNTKFILQGNIDIILDERTLALLKKQIKKYDLKNLFNIRLIQGMKIIFKENNDKDTMVNRYFADIRSIIEEKVHVLALMNLVRKEGPKLRGLMYIKKIIQENSGDITQHFLDELKINIQYVNSDFKVGLQYKDKHSETFSLKNELDDLFS